MPNGLAFEAVAGQPNAGISVSVIVDFGLQQLVAPSRNSELHILTVAVSGAEGASTPLAFCEEIGSPPVRITVADATTFNINPLLASGSVSVATSFLRGDVNGDQQIRLTDALALLFYLFQGEPLSCRWAADYDDNGSLNNGDALALLQFLFLAGLPPVAPYPNCGPVQTPSLLNCATPIGCP